MYIHDISTAGCCTTTYDKLTQWCAAAFGLVKVTSTPWHNIFFDLFCFVDRPVSYVNNMQKCHKCCAYMQINHLPVPVLAPWGIATVIINHCLPHSS